jgi:hypothetical protein
MRQRTRHLAITFAGAGSLSRASPQGEPRDIHTNTIQAAREAFNQNG